MEYLQLLTLLGVKPFVFMSSMCNKCELKTKALQLKISHIQMPLAMKTTRILWNADNCSQSELSEFSRKIYRYKWSELSRIVQNRPELSELSRERDIDQRMPDDANLLHQ